MGARIPRILFVACVFQITFTSISVARTGGEDFLRKSEHRNEAAINPRFPIRLASGALVRVFAITEVSPGKILSAWRPDGSKVSNREVFLMKKCAAEAGSEGFEGQSGRQNKVLHVWVELKDLMKLDYPPSVSGQLCKKSALRKGDFFDPQAKMYLSYIDFLLDLPNVKGDLSFDIASTRLVVLKPDNLVAKHLKIGARIVQSQGFGGGFPQIGDVSAESSRSYYKCSIDYEFALPVHCDDVAIEAFDSSGHRLDPMQFLVTEKRIDGEKKKLKFDFIAINPRQIARFSIFGRSAEHLTFHNIHLTPLTMSKLLIPAGNINN